MADPHAHEFLDGKIVVFICSPFKGDTAVNIKKAKKYCKMALESGFIPYAPHTALNGVLNDNKQAERETALIISSEMVKRCDILWVFGDTITEGMKREIEAASDHRIPIRFIGGAAASTEPDTVETWIERELSRERYNCFIDDLVKENDHDHPTYEEWRRDIEPDVIKEAKEKKSKGELS